MADLQKCRACSAFIRMVVTRKGRDLPLDPDPKPEGTFVLGWDGLARALKKSERQCRVCGCTETDACPDRATGTGCWWLEPDLCSGCQGGTPVRYVAHFATCTAPRQAAASPGAAVENVRRLTQLAIDEGRTAQEGLAPRRRP